MIYMYNTGMTLYDELIFLVMKGKEMLEFSPKGRNVISLTECA